MTRSPGTCLPYPSHTIRASPALNWGYGGRRRPQKGFRGTSPWALGKDCRQASTWTSGPGSKKDSGMFPGRFPARFPGTIPRIFLVSSGVSWVVPGPPGAFWRLLVIFGPGGFRRPQEGQRLPEGPRIPPGWSAGLQEAPRGSRRAPESFRMFRREVPKRSQDAP